MLMFNDSSYRVLKYSLTISMLLVATSCVVLAPRNTSHSQKIKKDSSRDSLRIYKKIKALAYQHKLTTLAYKAVFVDPQPKEYPTEPASNEEKNVNPYLKYQGRVIKDINIKVYDPFGHNISDTLRHTTNFFQRMGNKMHITTRHFVIINKLLFKPNNLINPLSLSETERVLREAVFINDVRIYISETAHPDSVVVNVMVHDKWPIIMPFLVTDVFVSAKFRNYNLVGVGQQFEQYGKYNRAGEMSLNGYYGIANIDHTYISANLGYSNSIEGTSINLSFDRPFFSPLSPWAGGLAVSHSWKHYVYTDSTAGVKKTIPLNSVGADVWAGKSVKLSKNNSLFNQSTNLILGGRYFVNEFLNRPASSIDSAQTYGNTHAALGNIGFAVQQYYKDKYIYRFGANEDVPEGLIVQVVYGGTKYEYKKIRYYAGAEVARAKRFKFGYLSATLSYGVFFNENVNNDITAQYKIYYFSHLFKKGRWLFREFLNFNGIHGENKAAGESVNFSGDELYGFENKTLSGNTKMTLNSETVAYLPYQLIGFRFAPVVNVGIGIIGSPVHQLVKSNLYQAYTIGLMVRNENLLSSTFQIAVGAYPFFPNGERWVLKYNPIASFTLRVRGFLVTRPEFISY